MPAAEIALLALLAAELCADDAADRPLLIALAIELWIEDAPLVAPAALAMDDCTELYTLARLAVPAASSELVRLP